MIFWYTVTGSRVLNFSPPIADETLNFNNTQQQDDHRSDVGSVSLSPPPVGGAGTPDRQLDMDTDAHHASELTQAAEGAQADGARADRMQGNGTVASTTVTFTTTSASVTTPSSGAPARRAYTRRSAALGQFYINRTEAEEAAIEKISGARKEAADEEKKFNAVLLRTAQAEEDAKKEVWKIKKDIAQKEKDMADVKKKTLDVEHITACIKRTTAILQYNAVAGNSNYIPLPPLPNILVD